MDDLMRTFEEERLTGLQALQRILEDAVERGADAVELEYVSEGLEVNYMFGDMGLGTVLANHELTGEIVGVVVDKARLDTRPRGEMSIDLFGRRHTILVEEYESFGESCFRLVLSESSSGSPEGAKRSGKE
jgi:hypothetical protein